MILVVFWLTICREEFENRWFLISWFAFIRISIGFKIIILFKYSFNVLNVIIITTTVIIFFHSCFDPISLYINLICFLNLIFFIDNFIIRKFFIPFWFLILIRIFLIHNFMILIRISFMIIFRIDRDSIFVLTVISIFFDSIIIIISISHNPAYVIIILQSLNTLL